MRRDLELGVASCFAEPVQPPAPARVGGARETASSASPLVFDAVVVALHAHLIVGQPPFAKDALGPVCLHDAMPDLAPDEEKGRRVRYFCAAPALVRADRVLPNGRRSRFATTGPNGQVCRRPVCPADELVVTPPPVSASADVPLRPRRRRKERPCSTLVTEAERPMFAVRLGSTRSQLTVTIDQPMSHFMLRRFVPVLVWVLAPLVSGCEGPPPGNLPVRAAPEARTPVVALVRSGWAGGGSRGP